MLYNPTELVALAKRLVDAARWCGLGEKNDFCDWVPDEETRKEFRKDLRNDCIALMEEAKLEEFRDLAKHVYRFLIRIDREKEVSKKEVHHNVEKIEHYNAEKVLVPY